MHYQRFKKSGDATKANPWHHHGLRESPEYETWCGMKKRCYNKNEHQYNDYGGRGIRVCDEWLHDFLAFYEYIGKRPDGDYSIDKINNDGNYEPGNVRWATRHQQIINQRLRKTNTSGYRGVYWYARLNKWVAKIGHNGHLVHLGYFYDIKEAALSYDLAAIQCYGDEVHFNII